MAFDRTRTLRGALAGAAAAGVWAAQQPLDKRVFGYAADDVELLGRLVARGPAVVPVGTLIHLANGALFGAAYANLAPSVPLPSAARGPVLGLLEHFATWPANALIERVHPAAGDLPRTWGSGRAFAQSTWRHLLFGVVLGELERRLNPPEGELQPVDEARAATNGHGSAEHLVTTGP
jgi:hypothetical protein